MPAVVGWQEKAVGLVVGGDDDAEAVENVIFPKVLFVYPQHVRRCGGADLDVIIELEAVEIAEIAPFIDPQDDRFNVAVELARQMCRRDFMKIPRSDGVLDRLQQRVFADPLVSAQQQRVIDLVAGMLPVLRQPAKNVVGVVRVDFVHVVEPGCCFALVDRGKELADHQRLTLATEIDVYFCDPRCPWQRGSSENTNRLLRQYLPRGTDLSLHSQAKLSAIARRLNERPRKTLLFQTPAEKFAECVAAIS